MKKIIKYLNVNIGNIVPFCWPFKIIYFLKIMLLKIKIFYLVFEKNLNLNFCFQDFWDEFQDKMITFN